MAAGPPDPDRVVIRLTAPDSPLAQQVLHAYFADIVGRYWGRPATSAELDRAQREDPSDDLALPTGVFVIARLGAEPVGCGGARLLAGGVAELTRVHVAAPGRRRGIATRIVGELEGLAVEHGRTLMRLDTRDDLIEARALYHRLGYREVEAFNRAPYAEHWFSRSL